MVLAAIAVSVLFSPVSGQVDVLPLTTRGDLLTRDASSIVRRAVGGANTVPLSDGTDWAWTSKTAAFDALSPLTTRGDLIYRDASNNVRLAKGTAGQFLSIGANDPAWANVPAFTGQFAFGDSAGINPADATTYYWGTLFGVDPGTTDDPPGFWIPVDCHLVAVYGSFVTVIAGTGGFTDTVTIRKNATTDILTVTSTVDIASSGKHDYSSTGNNIALSTGDKLYVKWLTPSWNPTNPTLVFGNMTLYFTVP